MSAVIKNAWREYPQAWAVVIGLAAGSVAGRLIVIAIEGLVK